MFDLVCEIEPPTRPDLRHVRHQIGVLAPVAHEVAAMGGRSIACLNSRDRNLLGFRRDLLTAAAYGVSEFLFVYGDKPSAGDRTSELTVRAMLDEARAFAEGGAFEGVGTFRIGVASGLRPMPA